MATTKKRRQYGTGSVYQRSTDGRWFGKISAGWSSTGTRRYITVSAKTEAEAKTKLKDKQRQIATEGLPSTSSRATVKAWSDEWLPVHAKAVRPSTYSADSGAVRKWIVPTIGHRRLADLTPGDVRAVRKAITDAGRTTTTARQAHWTLMGMLKAATLDGHPVPHRVLLVEAPTKAVNDREAIPLPDALKLLEVIASRGDRARWAAALLQAMRQGECLGLTRDCVDLDRRVLDVSWQLQSLPYVDSKDKSKGFLVPDGFEARHLVNAYHLTRPKTAKGQRIIPLVPWMEQALRDELARPQDNPWGLLWTGTDQRNGRDLVTPLRGSVDRAEWKAIQDVAGVRHSSGRPYTLHEARHTTATLLLEAGVDPETVKAIMGHSSIVTSRGYQHVSQELARKALEDVAGRLQLG